MSEFERMKAQAESIEARELAKAEHPWRKLLWLRHGCSISMLYGDDGEMQCAQCSLDFGRNSADEIAERFAEISVKQQAEAQS